MSVRRSLYLVVAAIAAPVGLCVSAMAPLAGVLAGVIGVGLVMLVSAAGTLLAVDWRAEVERQRAWAEVVPALAESNAGVPAEGTVIDTRYSPAFVSDPLRDVFRVWRFLPPQGAANAGSNWLASNQAVLKPATRSHAAAVIVLISCGNGQSARPADAGTEVVSAAGSEPPSCRGPPPLERRRSVRGAASNASPDGVPVVLDNLGQPVPVCAAELNVIETYLGDVLDGLLASSEVGSEPDRT
jgi:hypothetical protein